MIASVAFPPYILGLSPSFFTAGLWGKYSVERLCLSFTRTRTHLIFRFHNSTECSATKFLRLNLTGII
jgi:hypothetical protein